MKACAGFSPNFSPKLFAPARVAIPAAWDLAASMDIIEEKQQAGSIIITSPYPIAKWHHRMPHQTMAEAICDRLVRTAYKIKVKGEKSMRGNNAKSQVI